MYPDLERCTTKIKKEYIKQRKKKKKEGKKGDKKKKISYASQLFELNYEESASKPGKVRTINKFFLVPQGKKMQKKKRKMILNINQSFCIRKKRLDVIFGNSIHKK